MRAKKGEFSLALLVFLASCGAGSDSPDESKFLKDDDEVLSLGFLCDSENNGTDVTIEGEIVVPDGRLLPLDGKSTLRLGESVSLWLTHGDGPNMISNPSAEVVAAEVSEPFDEVDASDLEVTTQGGGTVGEGDRVQVTGEARVLATLDNSCSVTVDAANPDHSVVPLR